MKHNRRGYSIAELAIVIAVIAILTAILIPSFAGLTSKAGLTADTQTVRSLNMLLCSDKALGGSHSTMSDVVAVLEQNGFSLSVLGTSVTGNAILWDSRNDLFCYYYADTDTYDYISQQIASVDAYKYWMVYTSEPAVQKYSIYWDSTAVFTSDLTVGFDVGKNTTAMTLNYVGGSAAQSVIIRTNGQSLTVNAPNDTVKHYGTVNLLNVIAVSNDDCYREYGTVTELQSFASGKLVAEKTAKFVQSEAAVKAVKSDMVITAGATFGYIAPQSPDETSEETSNETSEESQEHVHTLIYINNGANHICKCTTCNYEELENHSLSGDKCSKCSYYCGDTVMTLYDEYNSSEELTWDECKTEIFKFADSGLSLDTSKVASFRENHTFVYAVITLPESEGIDIISDFSDCDWIKSIVIPNTVTVIRDGAFDNDTLLQTVYLSNGLTDIEPNLFNGCSSLKNVVLPTAAVRIQERAFLGCSALENLYIPAGIATISDNAFYGCTNLVITCGATSKPANWYAQIESHVNCINYSK